MSDDDIPVLTQILRTGSRRDLHAEPVTASSGLAAEATVSPDLDVRPLDVLLMGDALVIGNEPHADAAAGDHVAPLFDDDEAHDPARYAVADEALHDDQTIAQRQERRVNPFVSHEPRERRQQAGDVSLQRLAAITSSVRESVLVALQTRIDTELDARIAQAMHREVETAIAHLQDKLRDGLTEALRDVVARAVDDEMTRFVAAEREATARLDPRKPPVRFDA